jgi:translation initiation factor IF-2
VPIIERSAIPLSVQSFDIIYKLSEFVKEKLTALIPKEYIEEVTGRAKILALFSKEKDRQVVGGKVETGTMNSGNEVRIMRRSEEIGRGKIRELQSKKVRVSEVAEGFEFGTMIEAKIEIAVGDRIESVRTVEKVN